MAHSFNSSAALPPSDSKPSKLFSVFQSPYFLFPLIAIGIVVRILLILRSGNEVEGALGGGSDAPAYVLLGEAISKGKGMAYVGQPTALRAPLYPLLLAALKLALGGQALLTMRFIQLVAAVLTAWVCSKTAMRLWGKAAKWPAFAAAICVPTLLFFTTQIITETFTAFFVSIFVFFLLRSCLEEGTEPLIGLGLCSGLLLLLRFNTVFIPGIAAIAGLIGAARGSWRTAIRRALLPVAISMVMVSPWLVRNWLVFHGGILYSSQSGTTLLQGALSPDGRTQPYGSGPMQEHHAWLLSAIETDQPTRLAYPSEVELNRQAQANGRQAWRELGFGIFPLLAKKTSYFWLSADQLLLTRMFSGRQRVLRVAGVLVYWALLLGGVLGWLQVRKVAPRFANLLLLYCVFATLLHLPFTMNTRLRIPLVDPVLCVLASVYVSPLSRQALRE